MAKYLRKNGLKKYPTTHKKPTIWKSLCIALIMYSLLGSLLYHVFNMSVSNANGLGAEIVLVVMGFYYLIYGVIEGINKNKRCSIKVLAEIYDLKRKWNWNSDYKAYEYKPVYKFELDGKEYIVQSEVYCLDFGWNEDKIGDKDEIMVNPSNPIEIKRKGENSIFTIIGYGLMVVVNWGCACITMNSFFKI